MNQQPRYASITAGLLARKGDARPWSEASKRPLAWNTPEPMRLWDFEPAQAPEPPLTIHAGPPPIAEPDHAHGDHPHHAAQDHKKCTVRMSHHDYERLGILAVKLGKTRQRLLQEAVDKMLGGITRKYGGNCACLSAEDCCQAND
jgi:hypothetical protein